MVCPDIKRLNPLILNVHIGSDRDRLVLFKQWGRKKEAVNDNQLPTSGRSSFCFFPPLINCSESTKAARLSNVFNIYGLGPGRPRLDRSQWKKSAEPVGRGAFGLMIICHQAVDRAKLPHVVLQIGLRMRLWLVWSAAVKFLSLLFWT